MPYKDLEKRKQYKKDYDIKNKKRNHQYNKEYKIKNADKIKETRERLKKEGYFKEYYQINKEKWKKYKH